MNLWCTCASVIYRHAEGLSTTTSQTSCPCCKLVKWQLQYWQRVMSLNWKQTKHTVVPSGMRIPIETVLSLLSVSHTCLFCISQYISLFRCTMWGKSLHVNWRFLMARCYSVLVQWGGKFWIRNWSKNRRCCDWPLHSSKCQVFIFQEEYINVSMLAKQLLSSHYP